MRLSKRSYYSDFVVYPLILFALAAAELSRATVAIGVQWLCAIVSGIVLWTFMEYLLHRIALHRMHYFSPMHGLHHAEPLSYIGTPTWISVPILLVAIFIPVRLCFGLDVANGLTAGVMLGYWWYGIVHHVIHHRPPASSHYFDELRAWHMRHHRAPRGGNFGVTTSLWDHVFGTVIAVRRKEAVS